jgi:hypothetical protein
MLMPEDFKNAIFLQTLHAILLHQHLLSVFCGVYTQQRRIIVIAA